MLLDRAFKSVLRSHSDPLLQTILSSLDSVYPLYYQSLCSSATSPQLNRYVISLFGILQVVLRSPTFSSDNNSFHRAALNQNILFQSIKFTQLSDEIVREWFDDPMSFVDNSAESAARSAVRASIHTFSDEVVLFKLY